MARQAFLQAGILDSPYMMISSSVRIEARCTHAVQVLCSSDCRLCGAGEGGVQEARHPRERLSYPGGGRGHPSSSPGGRIREGQGGWGEGEAGEPLWGVQACSCLAFLVACFCHLSVCLSSVIGGKSMSLRPHGSVPVWAGAHNTRSWTCWCMR